MLVGFQTLVGVRCSKNCLRYTTSTGYVGVLDCADEATARFLVRKYRLLLREKGGEPIEITDLIGDCFSLYPHSYADERID